MTTTTTPKKTRTKKVANTSQDPSSNEAFMENLLTTLTAYRRGDLKARMPSSATGINGKANTFARLK